jgi:CheY-like chemotaxis protein
MAEEKNLKVMIVDDDQFLLNMYSMKFKNSGYEVDTAVGGQEAINKIKEGAKPDILLLDMVMPVMDGMELLRIIQRDHMLPKANFL